jgi:metallo-beta-lactamase family protein
MNSKRPLEHTLDNVVGSVISHGHFDHMGDLDLWAEKGHNFPIYTHKASKDLTRIQFLGNIGYDQWKFENGRGDEPQLSYQQAKKFIDERFVDDIGYGEPQKLSDNITATFYDAGHIIGSSQVLYEVNVDGKTVKILTAVDLGRSDIDIPIINKPHIVFPNDIDYALIESTCGGHLHKNCIETREEVYEHMKRIDRDKRIGIFGLLSTGRTHSALHDQYWSFQQGTLSDEFMIFLDSPSAAQQIPLTKKHDEIWDERMLDMMKSKYNLFDHPNLRIIRGRDESKALDKPNMLRKAPFVIDASSGMWSMGNIVRHLKAYVENENVDLFICSYQAPGTLGWQLANGAKKLKISGKEYKVKAKVHRIRGYGAHADGTQCVNHIVDYVKPKKGVLVTHGEKKGNNWMLEHLVKAFDKKSLNVPVKIARYGTVYCFDPKGLKIKKEIQRGKK